MSRFRFWVLLGAALIAGCASNASQEDNSISTTTTVTMAEPTTSLQSPTTTTLPQTTTTSSQTTTTSLSAPTTRAEAVPFRVLVFHKTTGFRHQSIPAGIQALQELGDESGFEVLATEDASIFRPSELERFEVIVFMNTTGDILNNEQQEAMEMFFGAGKGFVGVHSAADTEYDWPWYGSLIGAYFDNHPAPQHAVVRVLNPGVHPVTVGLESEIERFDEWYNFRTPPPSSAQVLAVVDESSYNGGNMGDPHPIVWAQEIGGGRSVYVGFGHTSESFQEPVVRRLLDNAIRWVGPEGD